MTFINIQPEHLFFLLCRTLKALEIFTSSSVIFDGNIFEHEHWTRHKYILESFQVFSIRFARCDFSCSNSDIFTSTSIWKCHVLLKSVHLCNVCNVFDTSWSNRIVLNLNCNIYVIIFFFLYFFCIDFARLCRFRWKKIYSFIVLSSCSWQQSTAFCCCCVLLSVGCSM